MAKKKPNRQMLRFPEFIGNAYHNVLLRDVTAECRIRNVDKLPPDRIMGVTKVDGIVPMEAKLIGADTSRYKIVRKNWFAYNPMRLNIGSIARWPNNEDVLVSPDYIVFRCLEEGLYAIDPEYLDHFRRSGQWKDFIKESGMGGVRVRIYFKNISRLRLKLPSFSEQQKITDCLGSLDKLIAAHCAKLDALQAHKKSLLQQLFPAEGQASPRIRFPEFNRAVRWEEKPLLDVFGIQDGFSFSSTDFIEASLNSQQVIRITDINNKNTNSDKVYFSLHKAAKLNLSRYIAKKGDLLLSLTGAAGFNFFIWQGEDAFLNQRTAKVFPKAKKYAPLIRLLEPLIHKTINNRGEGQNNNLSRGFLATVILHIPKDPAEQRRIANCLNALDMLIITQAEKIAALKKHKDGLMQQLFPNPEMSKL